MFSLNITNTSELYIDALNSWGFDAPVYSNAPVYTEKGSYI
jgi:hypothetical protein